jgi:hypothetical protein
MNEERQMYESRPARAMCTSHFANQYAGGYQPQGSPEIAAPGALRSFAGKRSKEKNRLPSFYRLRRQTAHGERLGQTPKNEAELASDNQLQHDPKAA